MVGNIEGNGRKNTAIERCFSAMSSIMTSERNRLGIEKAMKLCVIYRQQQFKRTGDSSIMREKKKARRVAQVRKNILSANSE